MSSNGTSAGGAGQGGGGPPGGRPEMTLDQILWMGLDTTPAKMTTAAAMAAIAVALVTSKILLDTGMYYDHFGSVDKAWVKWGVGLGCLTSVAHLMLCSAEVWLLIGHAFTEYSQVSKLVNDLGFVSDLMGVFFNLTVSTYYIWRVHKMSGGKWWLGAILMVLNVTTLVVGIIVAIKGLTAPAPSFETAMRLKMFYQDLAKLFKAWGAAAMTSDGALCATMIFYLFKSRTSLFHREKKIYHKVNALILESMMPPVICVLILDIQITNQAAPTGDWRRVLRALIPPLYFVSLIHSLVSRATIHRMLDKNLASEGVEHKSGSRSQGSVFVPTYSGYRGGPENAGNYEMGRDLESSTDNIVPLEKIHSYHRSASPVSDSSTHPNPRGSGAL